MKKNTPISLMSFFLLLSILLIGCEEKEKPNIDGERTKIESYITGLSDQEVVFFGENKYDKPLKDKTGIYRVFFRAEGDGGPSTEGVQIEKGDSVEIWFIAELFESKPSKVLLTNVPELIGELQDQAGLNAEYWSSESLKIKLGTTPLIGGLTRGLEQCVEKDSVMILLTSNLAFGNKYISTLPNNSSLSYKIRISRVVKAVK